MVAHYYSRNTQQRTGVGVPGTSFAPDGNLRLAVPVNAERASAPPSAAGPPPLHGGENLVLLLPGSPDEDSAPRLWLMLLIFGDAVTLVASLLELRWRTVYVTSLLTSGTAGLAVDALGAASCYRRHAGLLGLFAVAAVAQFCANALLLQSFPQMLHTALQPLLVRFALLLRRALVPQWLVHGRFEAR